MKYNPAATETAVAASTIFFQAVRRASKEVAAPPYGVQKTGRCDGQYSGAGTGQDDRPDDDCTDDADRIPHPASAG